MNNLPEANEVILGVDTHLDVHVGALISETGRLLGTFSVATNNAGYLKLLSWGQSYGLLRRAGVEGTGTYGAGLTRLLQDHGIEVWEVNRPDRSKRRLQGKSDPTDAENAARTVLAGSSNAIPKARSGAAEAMREISSQAQCSKSQNPSHQPTSGFADQCSAGNQRAPMEKQTW